MKKFAFVFSFILFAGGLQKAQAWGLRGHSVICESAVYLVKEEGLKEYLLNKSMMMAYLCNIPDIHWRATAEANKVGAPAHFVDADMFEDVKIKDLSLDLKELAKKYTGQPNRSKGGAKIIDFAAEFGTAWWRTDQFMRRAFMLKEDFSKATPPTNKGEEQDENFLFNKVVFQFLVNIGTMGHFVGDISQPFHNSVDYDGWMSGHGGIHAYYEDTLVSLQGPELMMNVIKKAKKLQKTDLVKGTNVERMRKISILSLPEIEKVYKIDKLDKPSEVRKEKGMDLKTAAVRSNAKKVAAKASPLIEEQMARSAALLAQLWDEAYVAIGRPAMTSYKSYRFPHTPDFIAPDYL
jgi:hypothetical protein